MTKLNYNRQIITETKCPGRVKIFKVARITKQMTDKQLKCLRKIRLNQRNIPGYSLNDWEMGFLKSNNLPFKLKA